MFYIFTFEYFRLSRRKRSALLDLDEKTNILNNFETYLPSLISLPPGTDNHECVLRAICEVARTPLTDDGLMGDFINLLLTPLQHEITAIQAGSDYIKAQQRGRMTHDCSSYQKLCGVSFFEVDIFYTPYTYIRVCQLY